MHQQQSLARDDLESKHKNNYNDNDDDHAFVSKMAWNLKHTPNH